MAIVTETWLQDQAVENTVIDVAGEHGLDAFFLNRQVTAANGRQYGGVAILGRSTSTKFSTLGFPNPDNFEVLAVAGKVNKIKEKAVVIGVYIPPNYPRVKAEACLDYISDVIAETKRKFESPLITVAGDWNQWNVDRILDDHPDLVEVEHGPTRAGNKIDKFLINFSRSVVESDVLPPLDDGLGRQSDHGLAFFKAKFDVPPVKKVSYRYRHFTDQGAGKFQEWISNHNFERVFAASNVNDKLESFLGDLHSRMDEFFPYKTTVR